MSEATKQTWAQVVEARAFRRGELQGRQDDLIMLLRATVGELPELLLSSIGACEDLDRLRAAILQTPKLKSFDELKF